MRNKIEIIIFVILLCGFGISYLVLPQRDFSEMENRYLSKCPEFSWRDLLNGSYTEEFESYTADQIMGKDFLVKLNVAANRAVGVSEIQQVYIGKDGYLIQDYQEPGELLQENLDYIRLFAMKHPDLDMTMLIVPNASEIYPEELPEFAQTYSQQSVIAEVKQSLEPQVQVVDVTDTLLEHKGEELYFRTDHHWNALGTYYAYEALCEALELEPVPYRQYDTYEVAQPFYGSLYSKAPVFDQIPDKMVLLTNPEGEYQVSYVSENRQSDSMLDYSYEEKKDKYAMYFGGNYPLTVIQSQGEIKEKVLILKDSYANSLVPLLADKYGEIHMMDLRYYHDDVDAYIENEGITRVIFIHNVDFLSTDNNFLWL